MEKHFAVGLLIGLGITLAAGVFGIWLVKALLTVGCLAASAIALNAIVTRLARIS